jgi:hypothetical protein
MRSAAPAQVAELVDALLSGSSAARREGSSPFLGTKYLMTTQKTHRTPVGFLLVLLRG